MSTLPKQLFVKELIGFDYRYEIYQADTQQLLYTAAEPYPKVLRYALNVVRLGLGTHLFPFHLVVKDQNHQVLCAIKKRFTLLKPTIEVLDKGGTQIGYLKQKVMALAGTFELFNNDHIKQLQIRGNLSEWKFKISEGETAELAFITKQWRGLDTELLSSADSYRITFATPTEPSTELFMWTIASTLSIDRLLK